AGAEMSVRAKMGDGCRVRVCSADRNRLLGNLLPSGHPERQRHAEPCAPLGAAAHVDRPAVCLAACTRDGQAESRPTIRAPALVILLEDMVELVLRNAATGVRDLDAQPV